MPLAARNFFAASCDVHVTTRSGVSVPTRRETGKPSAVQTIANMLVPCLPIQKKATATGDAERRPSSRRLVTRVPSPDRLQLPHLHLAPLDGAAGLLAVVAELQREGAARELAVVDVHGLDAVELDDQVRILRRD